MTNSNATETENFGRQLDEISSKVDKLGQKVHAIENFYISTNENRLSTSSIGSVLKDKQVPSLRKQQKDANQREAVAAKKMHDLMRQFGSIIRQITQHKWAWPFMQPVDVEGLGLDDYYEVIDRPMDFSTIKNQMEAKDGTGYKNVRDIFADMRLVFDNAMQYNDEKSDVHLMAKTLSEKFEEKWQLFLPKVMEEEKRREEEESEAQIKMTLAQDAANGRIAKDLRNELCDMDNHLEELCKKLVQKCRKFTIEEKRNIGIDLTKLSPEDLSKVLDIVAQNNPSFLVTVEEVDLDIDSLSESTLWRLKFFLKEALQVPVKCLNDDANTAATTHIEPKGISVKAKKRRKKDIPA
ncbi:transcription factor GTE6-like [Impatiens glandulifera]|uniref:transcription factor GTE6-like n=1 Tax=Impatiens glandulifera TaxID=253017 RepID=UPI001FB19D1D|nr:transcription factor GTE6-like [Impatiens glandulifera]